MKVIKEGKIPEVPHKTTGVFYRAVCQHCQCEFEADENDVETETKVETGIWGFYGSWDERLKITYTECPTCKHKVNVASEVIEFGMNLK
jgi:hypothetical protein